MFKYYDIVWFLRHYCVKCRKPNSSKVWRDEKSTKSYLRNWELLNSTLRVPVGQSGQKRCHPSCVIFGTRMAPKNLSVVLFYELNKQNLVSQMTMILPIFTFFKLHAKVCDVCSLKLGRRIQKTQNYTTQIKVRLESIGNKCNCDL